MLFHYSLPRSIFENINVYIQVNAPQCCFSCNFSHV